MYNTGKIIIGIVVFLCVFLFPLWYNQGRPVVPPELERPKDEKQCVEATDFMKSSHMELLDSWRNSVVRDGNRVFTNSGGKKYVMSLQITCMQCHKSREKFCDRCHNYMQVSPNCWDCHIAPEFKIAGRSN